MFRGSYYFVFALIAVLLLGLLFGGSSEQGGDEQERVLPEAVRSQMQDLSQVSITAQGGNVNLQRQEGGWVVANRYNYGANEAKLVSLLRDLRDARLLEEKTAKPENHNLLGIGDDAFRVELDSDVTLLIGNRSSGRPGRYLRYGDSDQVWLQSALLTDLEASPGRWLEDEILAVPKADIRSISIQHPNETLSLQQSETGEVEVVGVPQEALRYAGIADGLFNMISDLRLQDITPLDEIEFAGGVLLDIDLNGSGTIEMQLVRQDGDHWLKVLTAPEGALKARSGFAFKISPLNYDNMTKTRASLLKEEG